MRAIRLRTKCIPFEGERLLVNLDVQFLNYWVRCVLFMSDEVRPQSRCTQLVSLGSSGLGLTGS